MLQHEISGHVFIKTSICNDSPKGKLLLKHWKTFVQGEDYPELQLSLDHDGFIQMQGPTAYMNSVQDIIGRACAIIE